MSCVITTETRLAMSKSQNNPYAVLALHLWNEYRDALPDAPSRMAGQILIALEESGLTITQIPNEELQRDERSPRKVWWVLVFRSAQRLFPKHILQDMRRHH